MKKGKDTIANICAVNDVMDVPMESAKMGIRIKSTGRMGASCLSCRRIKKGSYDGEKRNLQTDEVTVFRMRKASKE